MRAVHINEIHTRWVGLRVWLHNSHHGVEDCILHSLTAKSGRVAADAAAKISAETAALIAGSNEDLV